MLAMLRKDCYVMGKYTVAFAIFWMLMAGMYAWVQGAERTVLYCAMPAMASTIVLNAVSNDQACRWDRFAAMTPLRPWELVLEKYLFAYGVLTVMVGLGVLAGWISARSAGDAISWTVAVLVTLFTAMALPLVYRFGRQKGANILLITWGLLAAAILGIAHWNYALIELAFGWMEAIPLPALAAGIVLLLLLLNALSFLLSVRFYTRRQRGRYD